MAVNARRSLGGTPPVPVAQCHPFLEGIHVFGPYMGAPFLFLAFIVFPYMTHAAKH